MARHLVRHVLFCFERYVGPDGVPHKDNGTRDVPDKGKVMAHLFTQREQLSAVVVLGRMAEKTVANLRLRCNKEHLKKARKAATRRAGNKSRSTAPRCSPPGGRRRGTPRTPRSIRRFPGCQARPPP